MLKRMGLFAIEAVGDQLSDLIIQGKDKALRTRLDFGLDPNHKMGDEFPLLYSAIDCKQPKITVLLLKCGASPNLVGNLRAKGKTPVDKAIERFNQGLIKLLFTYGASLERFENHYHNSPKAAPFRWIKSIKDNCLRIHALIQAGEQAFAKANYESAKPCFEEAEELLTKLANDEEHLRQEDDSHPIFIKVHPQARNYRTDPIYIKHFYDRAAFCQEKVALCEQYLSDEASSLLLHAKMN